MSVRRLVPVSIVHRLPVKLCPMIGCVFPARRETAAVALAVIQMVIHMPVEMVPATEPRSSADEDSAVIPLRSVITVRRAGVRRSLVVAPETNFQIRILFLGSSKWDQPQAAVRIDSILERKSSTTPLDVPKESQPQTIAPIRGTGRTLPKSGRSRTAVKERSEQVSETGPDRRPFPVSRSLGSMPAVLVSMGVMHRLPMKLGPVVRRMFSALRQRPVIALPEIQRMIHMPMKVVRPMEPRPRADKHAP